MTARALSMRLLSLGVAHDAWWFQGALAIAGQEVSAQWVRR